MFIPRTVLQIDLFRLSLNTIRNYYTVKRPNTAKLKTTETAPLPQQIYEKIKTGGPISVADYMKTVLTNPVSGYYMNKDVFGATGDFITSPEITQMFGEVLAVWILNEWSKLGAPKPFQIVELGPGRGTLSADILKIFNHFKALHGCHLSLVEVSPHLSELQAKQLCGAQQISNNLTAESAAFKQGITKEGIPVKWYKHFSETPCMTTIVIAHEFFDALPVHKFFRSHSGYNEVLIDVKEDDDESLKTENDNNKCCKFRYVLSRNETTMQKILLKKGDNRDHVEIAPIALDICRQICERLKNQGGFALICDYGHNGDDVDSFRAFKAHKQVHPLDEPGSADLTADVDFNLFRQIANDVGDILTMGPVTQRDFLLKSGLEFRYNNLIQNPSNKKDVDNLKACYHFLIDNDKMGERFKFFALYPKRMKKLLDQNPAVGFT